MSNKATTVEAKHVFLDIVNYTHGRSIEAQTDLISFLNAIVKYSIKKNRVKSENIIYIPTGDGMCISIINKSNPFDIHLLVAIDILYKLHEHNSKIDDEMRRFYLRISINENSDNLIIDINNQSNISGAGINIAARLITFCDANQIIISNTVFDRIMQREKYLKSFVEYTGEVKHGLRLSMYQYINNELSFLNNNTPSIFIPKIEKSLKLTDLAAHYLAVCIIHEEFIVKNLQHSQAPYSMTYLLYHLAEDSLSKSRVTKTKPKPYIKTKRPIQEEFNYFQSVDFWLLADLESYIKIILSNFSGLFTDGYLVVNEKGYNKLREEYPALWNEIEHIQKSR